MKKKLPSRKLLYQEIAAAINTRDLTQIFSTDTLRAHLRPEDREVMRRVVADVATYCLETAQGVKEDVW